MREVVAESRIQVMTALFSFLFNDNSRNFGNSDLKCESSSDTEKTLMTSELFEYLNETAVTFDNANDTVTEWAGFAETGLTRLNSTVSKTGIAFIKYIAGSADESDIVPYNGPVVFMPNEEKTTIFTQIKNDNKDEEDEEFSYSLKTIASRKKRSPGKRGKGGGKGPASTDDERYVTQLLIKVETKIQMLSVCISVWQNDKSQLCSSKLKNLIIRKVKTFKRNIKSLVLLL